LNDFAVKTITTNKENLNNLHCQNNSIASIPILIRELNNALLQLNKKKIKGKKRYYIKDKSGYYIM